MNKPAPSAPIAPGTTGEAMIRPKVLRRPLNLNPSAAEAPNLSKSTTTQLALIAPQIEATEQPTFRPWQEDGRFAATLLAILLVINFAVMVWLSAISPEKSHIIHVTQFAKRPANAPDITVFGPSSEPKIITEWLDPQKDEDGEATGIDTLDNPNSSSPHD